MDEPKKPTKREVIKVVMQLPTEYVRTLEDETTIYHLVTVEEYLTDLANARSK